MSTVYMMEAANLFAGDADPNASNHLTLQTLKLPGMEENFTDHTPGGASVGVEFDTHTNRLEATFNLAGWNPQVMSLIGRWSRERQRFTALGAIRDRMTGRALQAKAIMWGRLGRVNPTEFRRGDLQGHEYSIRAIVHYELNMGDQPIFYWDFFTNSKIIGGVDINAEINSLIGIPSDAQVAPGGSEVGGRSEASGGIVGA